MFFCFFIDKKTQLWYYISGYPIKKLGIKGGGRLKLSTRGKYGMHAMVFLGKQAGKGPQPLKEIAQTGVPEQYLEQLLGSLRRGGLVTTVRGAQGGYMLSKPPEKITIREILDLTEGPLQFAQCLEEGFACHKSQACPSRKIWEYLDDKINTLLEGVTLGEILMQDDIQ